MQLTEIEEITGCEKKKLKVGDISVVEF
jgi:hypothetical protein